MIRLNTSVKIKPLMVRGRYESDEGPGVVLGRQLAPLDQGLGSLCL